MIFIITVYWKARYFNGTFQFYYKAVSAATATSCRRSGAFIAHFFSERVIAVTPGHYAEDLYLDRNVVIKKADDEEE